VRTVRSDSRLSDSYIAYRAGAAPRPRPPPRGNANGHMVTSDLPSTTIFHSRGSLVFHLRTVYIVLSSTLNATSHSSVMCQHADALTTVLCVLTRRHPHATARSESEPQGQVFLAVTHVSVSYALVCRSNSLQCRSHNDTWYSQPRSHQNRRCRMVCRSLDIVGHSNCPTTLSTAKLQRNATRPRQTGTALSAELSRVHRRSIFLAEICC
jgi:hypothetical protein